MSTTKKDPVLVVVQLSYTGGAHGNTKYVSYTLRDGCVSR